MLQVIVLIDTPEHQESVLEFDLLVVYALHNSGKPAPVIVWYCFPGQILLPFGPILARGQDLWTPLIYSTSSPLFLAHEPFFKILLLFYAGTL